MTEAHSPDHSPPAIETRPVELPRWSKLSVLTMAVILTTAALYFASVVLVPIIVASLLAITFKPVVKALHALGVPPPLGATCVVFGLAAAIALGVTAFSGPLSDMIERAPSLAYEVRDKLADVIRPVMAVNRATTEVEQLADGAETPGTQTVVVQEPGLAIRAVDDLIGFIVGVGFVLFLAFFFLASGDAFAERLVTAVPRLREKKQALSIIRSVESDMSRYLFTITVINSCLGLAIGSWLWWLGMPTPMMWGVGAALLNFLPYLGPLTGTVLVGGVALITFDSPAYAALAPIGWMTLCTIEGQLLTPIILGRRLELGPSAILIAIGFFGWLWGIIGMIVAVPILMVIKIVSEQLESWALIASLLSNRRRENGGRTAPAGPVAQPPAA